ncbi:hypothetical protein L6452_36853 [Arctium lappa]|uniref:Uncharacterized protein n=1 Tax=Arctium lappa TaxID=4217 RepID=A0ACB8Y235_ARCLA|nr:hypothetical protein L6452_36853 [Arctium lappa]
MVFSVTTEALTPFHQAAMDTDPLELEPTVGTTVPVVEGVAVPGTSCIWATPSTGQWQCVGSPEQVYSKPGRVYLMPYEHPRPAPLRSLCSPTLPHCSLQHLSLRSQRSHRGWNRVTTCTFVPASVELIADPMHIHGSLTTESQIRTNAENFGPFSLWIVIWRGFWWSNGLG